MSFITKSKGAALVTGAALALAAASMVGCAAYKTTDSASNSVMSDVHCYGVNKCKGHNDCKTANNACKGHSACKGQGFVNVSASACAHVGGKVGT